MSEARTAPVWAGELWAMEREAFQAMVEADPKALGSNNGGGSGAPSYEVVDGVAVFDVRGPLAARPSFMARLFARVFGTEIGHTYETLLASIGRAERDGRVRSLRFVFDSPGGQVTGLVPVVRAIEACAKPTEAHAAGLCASAAYWLAAACDRITAEPTAIVGGLGVQVAVRLGGERGQVLRIVSSQTRHKNADPATDEGREAIQERIDDLCTVFLDDVARLRGVTREQVDGQYGEGKAFVAARAEERGLVDSVITAAKEDPMAKKNGVFATLRTQLEEALAKFEGNDDDKAQGFLGSLKESFAKVFAKGEEFEAAAADAEAEVERLKAAGLAKEDEAQLTDPKVLAELAELRGALGREKAARLAEQKAHALAGLVKDGKVAPADKELAAMAWDAEQRDPELKVFTRLFAERDANSAVPLKPVGSSGAPLDMSKAELREHVKSMAEAEGILFEEALNRHEAEEAKQAEGAA